MTKKSITKSRPRGRSKPECPRADVPTRGNSPDWYTRESLPYQGENFNALTSLAPQPGVMFRAGVSTSAAVIHRTVIHPPVDRMDSFYKKAADFYAEIRERNSGAANYNVVYLAAYMYNVGVLHALSHAVARAIKAVRSVMPSSADSPYLLSALAGVPNYEDVASRLAVLINQYTLLAKDIENLPLPHVTAFDRSRFLYSSFFADSKNPKPSLISFCPTAAIYAEISGTGSSATVTYLSEDLSWQPSAGSSFLDKAITFMETLLEKITIDNIYTIIRGDIRNAFGVAAYWEGLVALPTQPLKLIPEDPETMSQLENLSLIPRDISAMLVASYEYSQTDGQYVLRLRIDGINDSPGLSRVWCDNNLVNYHGVSVSDGDLLAITRMMYVGRKENNLTYTDAVILASSGNTVYSSNLITSVAKNTYSSIVLTDELLNAQASTVQSTMAAAFHNLTFAASNIQHFPMLIWADEPRAYMWSTDNYAVMSNVNLVNMTIIANRSMWDVHLPRGAEGRLQKKA